MTTCDILYVLWQTSSMLGINDELHMFETILSIIDMCLYIYILKSKNKNLTLGCCCLEYCLALKFAETAG